jgi:putative ABC transport system permease protein
MMESSVRPPRHRASAGTGTRGLFSVFRALISRRTDLRLAFRSLLGAKGFTTAAVLTLGLGMTLCTTATVVVSAYLLNDLPYPAADRLYWIRYGIAGQDQPRNMEKLDWASLDDVIEHPVAWDLDVFYLLGGEHAQSIPGAWVTSGFVRGLGIQPAIGRGFDAGAFAPGGPNVALISHRLWSSRFGSDPGIVGRTFTAYVSDRPEEAESFTVVGVMPQRFWHINSYTDILTPLRAPTYPYMARLRAGITPDVAASRITALVSAGAASVPQNWSTTLVSAHEAHVQTVRPMLRAVTLAATLVLLVACANVAGLLLVRATRRQKEMAVRAALGAGRGAIARMLLAEGLILGLTATIVALFLTRLTLDVIAPMIEQQLGRSVPGGPFALALDARTMSVAAGVGILTALMCGLVPLAASLRGRLLGGLQSGSRTITEGGRNQRIRAALIAVEVALSLTLLAGSALMLRTVLTLLHTDLGFTADRVLNASMTLRQNRYPDPSSRAAIFDGLATRLGTIAGVESVGLTTAWPLQQPRVQPIERVDGSGRAGSRAAIHGVSDTYFSTLEIPTTAGRGFGKSDRIGSAPVAVVSEALARRLWPGASAIGQRVSVPQSQDRGEPVPVEREVVGVVRDVRQDPSDSDLADLYVPMLQAPTRFAFVLVRTAGAPANWLAPLRSAVRDVDPELAMDRARPMQLAVHEVTARPRFLAWLLGAFAAIAALLALVGVYGVIAYAVRQREREIAVRLAIGADPGRITRLFLRQGGVILLAGLALGIVGALAAGRLIESQLVGVTPRDPMALAMAVAAFAMAGLAAIWWPSRRAGATDPAIALKAE